jgi:molybdopterin molybdotransferase
MEDVNRENGRIRIARAVSPGTHIFPPGEDAHTGDELASPGVLLGPPVLGLLASAGVARVRVFRRPRVAIVTTGDELVELDRLPGPGQIRNSNATVVSASVARLGGSVVAVDQVADDAVALRAAFASVRASCDLLVTTGGASVGERDFVKRLLRDAGCAFAFESVALRPAKPTAFGMLDGVRVCVLPGNPSSAFVALHEFVRPALLALAGRNDPRLPRVQATLSGRIHAKAQRTYAAYATLRAGGAGFVATPLPNQCSALTRTAADADGFIVAPPGAHEYVSGETVAVDVFDWSRVASARS